ncbi:MAG: hypothetical protein ACXVVQ_19550 [Solirubrobacteraceae bacterium]
MGLTANPVAGTRKRRQMGQGDLEVFTVGQIEALARAAETGAWRRAGVEVSVETRAVRAAEGRQFGDFLQVAAYTGLRRGELVALRW